MPQPILIEFQTDLTGVNNALDAMEQMGLVDKATAEQFRKTSAEAQRYATEMNKLGKNVDAVTIDMGELVSKIKEVPKKIIEDSAKKSVDDTAKSMAEVTARSVTLTSELKKMKQALSEMEMAGRQNTAEYRKLAMEAGQLEDQIGDTAQRVKVLASDTRNLDAALSLATGVAGGFAVAQGAAALFGDENEDLQRALLKVQAALSILNGLQALQATLNKNSAASVVIMSAAQKAYTIVVGTSTGALKAFRIALAATGIGAIVLLLYEAANAFNIFGSAAGDAADDLDDANKRWEEWQDNENKTALSLARVSGYWQRQLELRKAQGAAEAELLDLRKKAIADEMAGIELALKRNTTLEVTRQLINRQLDLENELKILDAEYTKQSLENAKKRQESEAQIAFQNKELLIKTRRDGFQEELALFDLHSAKRIEDAKKAGLDISLVEAQIFDERQKMVEDFNAENMAGVQEYVTAYSSAYEQAYFASLSANEQEIAAADKKWQALISMADGDQALIAQLHEKWNEEITEITQRQAEEQRKIIEQTEQQKRDEFTKTFNYYASVILQVTDIISQFQNAAYEQDAAKLEEALENKRISETNYDKQIGRLKRERAIKEKQAAIFQATINTAGAVVQALNQFPGVPATIPFGVIAGLLGAAQIAAIAAQPIPQFAKGTKNAPAGMKWVGEEGPELINDGGGYAIIPHAESMAIAEAFDRWGIGYDMEGTAYVGGAAIDYDKLARALAKEIGSLPITETYFDESGFTRAIRNGQSRVSYLDSRYSS